VQSGKGEVGKVYRVFQKKMDEESKEPERKKGGGENIKRRKTH